jgi:hypothetical protein
MTGYGRCRKVKIRWQAREKEVKSVEWDTIREGHT